MILRFIVIASAVIICEIAFITAPKVVEGSGKIAESNLDYIQMKSFGEFSEDCVNNQSRLFESNYSVNDLHELSEIKCVKDIVPEKRYLGVITINQTGTTYNTLCNILEIIFIAGYSNVSDLYPIINQMKTNDKLVYICGDFSFEGIKTGSPINLHVCGEDYVFTIDGETSSPHEEHMLIIRNADLMNNVSINDDVYNSVWIKVDNPAQVENTSDQLKVKYPGSYIYVDRESIQQYQVLTRFFSRTIYYYTIGFLTLDAAIIFTLIDYKKDTTCFTLRLISNSKLVTVSYTFGTCLFLFLNRLNVIQYGIKKPFSPDILRISINYSLNDVWTALSIIGLILLYYSLLNLIKLKGKKIFPEHFSNLNIKVSV